MSTEHQVTEPGPVVEVLPEESRKLEGQRLYRSGPIEAPVLLERAAGRVPDEALERLTTGETPTHAIVQAIVTTEGRVASFRVLRVPEVSGVDLEAALAEALRQWRFEPALLDGEPVPVYFNLTVQMELGSGSS